MRTLWTRNVLQLGTAARHPPILPWTTSDGWRALIGSAGQGESTDGSSSSFMWQGSDYAEGASYVYALTLQIGDAGYMSTQQIGEGGGLCMGTAPHIGQPPSNGPDPWLYVRLVREPEGTELMRVGMSEIPIRSVVGPIDMPTEDARLELQYAGNGGSIFTGIAPWFSHQGFWVLMTGTLAISQVEW